MRPDFKLDIPVGTNLRREEGSKYRAWDKNHTGFRGFILVRKALQINKYKRSRLTRVLQPARIGSKG